MSLNNSAMIAVQVVTTWMQPPVSVSPATSPALPVIHQPRASHVTQPILDSWWMGFVNLSLGTTSQMFLLQPSVIVNVGAAPFQSSTAPHVPSPPCWSLWISAAWLASTYSKGARFAARRSALSATAPIIWSTQPTATSSAPATDAPNATIPTPIPVSAAQVTTTFSQMVHVLAPAVMDTSREVNNVTMETLSLEMAVIFPAKCNPSTYAQLKHSISATTTLHIAAILGRLIWPLWPLKK